MLFSETLTEQQRRKARLHAYASTWFGCISELMVDQSAIVILFLQLLGGTDTMGMLACSFSGFCSMLLMIPFTGIVNRVGQKRAVKIACLIGFGGLLLMALAPLFGKFGIFVAMFGCLLYCLQRGLYSIPWYPLLNGFLRPNDRGLFFGVMRFSYTMICGSFFFLVGLLLGKKPPMIFLQAVIVFAAVTLLLRSYFISKFPEDSSAAPEPINYGKALGDVVRNRGLAYYSIYSCIMAIAYTSLLPMVLLYLKYHVGMDAGMVQILSTCGMAGGMTGFLLYAGFLKSIRLKRLEFAVHIMYVVIALLLCVLNETVPGFTVIIACVIFSISFTASIWMCNYSSEILALSSPGNRNMCSAFVQTYTNTGVAIGRMGTSAIIGSALLAPEWVAHGHEFSKYHSMFILYSCIMLVAMVMMPMLPSFVADKKE